MAGEAEYFDPNYYTSALHAALLASGDPNDAALGQTYKGRPIICKDSPINGGVWAVGQAGVVIEEALVVDDREPSSRKPYDKLYRRAVQLASDKAGFHPHLALAATYKAVGEAITYSRSGLDQLLRQLAREPGTKGDHAEGLRPGTKVDLSWFLLGGVGICRHQALAAAYVLERMIGNRMISGTVSADRSVRWMGPSGSGHAWARYTPGPGEDPVIIDVAEGYLGTLEAAFYRRTMASQGQTGAQTWQYARQEDLDRYAAATTMAMPPAETTASLPGKQHPDDPAGHRPGARRTPRNAGQQRGFTL